MEQMFVTGINVQEERISMVRLPDDTLLISESEVDSGLISFNNKLLTEYFGLKNNKRETKGIKSFRNGSRDLLSNLIRND